MAIENNPFYIRPVNPLEALLVGQQGYDSARKNSLEDQLRTGRVEAARRAQAGDMQGAASLLLGAGDVQGANVVAHFAENQANRGFRESEAQRNQRNADRSFSLQERQATAALEGQRVPPGFARGADGSLAPVPGGPADPAYLRATTEAKGPTIPSGFARNAEGGLAPIPGGPSDPAYLKTATAAKEKGGVTDEQKLRKEFEMNSKTHLDVRRGYQRLLASKDNAAGDISLIFGYMKMLDPGSVVREGEFATAQNAAGIPDIVRNMYNRAMEGTRLNPNQREQFKGQAQSLYDSSLKEYNARSAQFSDIARQHGFDPRNVIQNIGPEPFAGPRSQPQSLGLPNLPPPPPGAIIVGR